MTGCGDWRMQTRSFRFSQWAARAAGALGIVGSSGQQTMEMGCWSSADRPVSIGSPGAICEMKQRWPPLSKNPRTARDRFALAPAGAARSKSAKLVSGPSNAPRPETETNPVVLVETPSIGLAPEGTSSTYTPGCMYSDMTLQINSQGAWKARGSKQGRYIEGRRGQTMGLGNF